MNGTWPYWLIVNIGSDYSLATSHYLSHCWLKLCYHMVSLDHDELKSVNGFQDIMSILKMRLVTYDLSVWITHWSIDTFLSLEVHQSVYQWIKQSISDWIWLKLQNKLHRGVLDSTLPFVPVDQKVSFDLHWPSLHCNNTQNYAGIFAIKM